MTVFPITLLLLLIPLTTAVLQFWHHATGGGTSVRDKVGGEDPDAPVIQLPLPPVVLRVCLGDDGDAVAGGDAQVAGLLTGERVDGRDHQLTGGSAHWRTFTRGGEMVQASTFTSNVLLVSVVSYVGIYTH